METSRVALIALVCVVFSGQKRISGAEVETRVRRGDDVTLYSDCVVKSGFYPVWFRNCSHQDQPRLMISHLNLMHGPFPRHSFVFNVSTNVHDLLIKNVTESDVGVYYCALTENIITKDKDGVIISTAVFHYGNRWTRLSVLGSEKRGTPLTEHDFQVHQCERSVNGEFCCHTEVFYTLQKPAIKSD
ncbi:uncharacterized protein LOC124626524 isoform X3 [Ictalurus punctatus]|uniref:Uncharacterized protein LOC124626524 isoform X3 n=1 Tax=Ictalurus punctatus TaxID=7998 RepID=A0A9F7RB11_ICTPU|nr:uncharacterized protein LOC124626524 isoform X3 [Ictalurus punctatus]